MAIEILGTGQPDGTAVVKSTSEKIHLYGGTAVSQAATISNFASVTVSNTNVSTTNAAVNAMVTKLNILLDDLSDIGVHASS